MAREAIDEKPDPAGGGTYRLEPVRCGKPTCTKCPHGPYWYLYRRNGNRVTSKYIGKNLPAGVAGGTGSAVAAGDESPKLIERAAGESRGPAPAPAAGGSEIRERLEALTDRQEARDYLDSLKLRKADLAAAAAALGFPARSGQTAADIKRNMVEVTVGARSDAAAIGSGVRKGRTGAALERKRQAMAAAEASAAGNPGPVSGRLSGKPLTPNKWGVPAPGHPVSFHDDNPIGLAIRGMGQDAHLDVDGEPLADVLGKIATDAGHGVITAQEALDRVKQLRDRLPDGGSARYALDTAIRRELDAPDTPPPAVPDGTPEPLRRLMAQLHAVPAVRRDPDGEDRMLARALADHAAGGHAVLLRRAVGQLRNRRHESTLGWREINDAVRQAEEDLKTPQRQERETAPRTPARPAPAPERKRKGIWGGTDDRAETALPAALAAASALRDAPVDDRVRAAYQALADGTPAAYVRIADLRRALPDVPRPQLDYTLGRMYRDHRANLVSQADQENLTGEDRQSSLHIGGMDKHRISIEPDSGY